MKRIYLWLHNLFWRTLCPYPDQTRIGMWWYHHSGNIASFFYRKAHGIKGKQRDSQ